jgi:hypothetical protein
MIPRSEKKVTVGLSCPLAIELSVRTLKRLTAHVISRSADSILAQTNLYIRSYGEDIVITVSEAGPNACSIRIQSESRVKTTIVDWGAGAKTVERIAEEIASGVAGFRASVESGSVCPTCGQDMNPESQFCPNDGTAISRSCTRCSHVSPPNARFCTACGAKL